MSIVDGREARMGRIKSTWKWKTPEKICPIKAIEINGPRVMGDRSKKIKNGFVKLNLKKIFYFDKKKYFDYALKCRESSWTE